MNAGCRRHVHFLIGMMNGVEIPKRRNLVHRPMCPVEKAVGPEYGRRRVLLGALSPVRFLFRGGHRHRIGCGCRDTNLARPGFQPRIQYHFSRNIVRSDPNILPMGQSDRRAMPLAHVCAGKLPPPIQVRSIKPAPTAKSSRWRPHPAHNLSEPARASNAPPACFSAWLDLSSWPLTALAQGQKSESAGSEA